MIHGGESMLARILYYRDKEMPWEIVVPANDIARAEELARKKMREFRAVDYEIELIA
ncbi:hypothetical protein [Thermococcus waiotapuensis]|uniref:Uncharacterized protein n=1 Tax=Thermococcus waiotapuensis TaxID=90909 RepID=A0AAE4NRV8_9EURY|nr:hypothetical protein [Thermococcus waiotapuensis]MDV3103198.1 hypothetical protein [Thermococcus waiotapuensis]